MSAMDKRNDCMAALHKLVAKFAANQPGSTGYENAATGSGHDAFLLLSLGRDVDFAPTASNCPNRGR